MPRARSKDVEIFIFSVTARDRATVNTVKDSLRSQLNELITTVEVGSEVIEIIGTKVVDEIESLGTPEVCINVGKSNEKRLLNASKAATHNPAIYGLQRIKFS
jgi:hypothetical protein